MPYNNGIQTRSTINSINEVQKWKGRILYGLIIISAKSVNRIVGMIANTAEQPDYLRRDEGR
jgi:hypothetical protein